MVPIDITRRCSWPAGMPGGRPVSKLAVRPSPSSSPSGSWMLDQELMGVVGLVPGDVDAEGDVEGPVVRQLRQAQHVPAAAGHVELAVDGLGVVGEEEEADVHCVRVGDDGQVGEQLDLAVAAELEVDRLVLAVGAEEPEVHRQPAAGADLLLDDRAGEDDLAGLDRVVGALALLDAVDEDGEGGLGAGAAASPARRRRSCPSGSRSSALGSSLPRRVSRTGVERRLVVARVELLAPHPAAVGDEVPSPRTSMPATGLRSSPLPDSCSRA